MSELLFWYVDFTLFTQVLWPFMPWDFGYDQISQKFFHAMQPGISMSMNVIIFDYYYLCRKVYMETDCVTLQELVEDRT